MLLKLFKFFLFYCVTYKNCSTKKTQFFFEIVLSLLFLALLFFLVITKVMSKRKAPVITYKDVVQNILTFIENDDMKDELDLLLENQRDDDEFEIEENDAQENLIDDGEEVPEQKEELNPRRNRRLLTRNRLVCDINSALDKNNYDPIHYINGNEHSESLTGYLGQKADKKTETITWPSTLPSQTGRERR